jgi:hypothetical protein
MEDDDDEPIRPRSRDRDRPKKGGGMALGVAIGIIVALLLLIGGGLAVLLPILSPSVRPVPVFATVSTAPPPPPQKGRRPQEPVPLDNPPEPPPQEVPPILSPRPTGPRVLDWVGLNVADVNVGDLSARPAVDLEALRFLPPSADAVFGLDTASLNRKLVFGWLMQRIAVLGEECPLDHLERETGFRLKDLDHVVVTGKFDLGPDNWAKNKPFPVETTTYVIQTKVPFNLVTLLKQARAGPAKQWQGREYYPLPEARRKTPAFMIVPTDRIVLVTMLPAEQLGAIFKLPGDKPALAQETVATLRAMDRAHAWVVVPPNQVSASLAANIPALSDAMAQAKAAGLAVRFHADVAHVRTVLMMTDAEAGTQTAAKLQKYWSRQEKGTLASIARAAPDLQFQNRSESVAIVAPVRFQLIDELLNAGE